MKKTAKKVAPVEVEVLPYVEPNPVAEVAPDRALENHTRVIRAVVPYTDEMISALEHRLDALVTDGFEVVACLPYGVDHMVILLKRSAA